MSYHRPRWLERCYNDVAVVLVVNKRYLQRACPISVDVDGIPTLAGTFRQRQSRQDMTHANTETICLRHADNPLVLHVKIHAAQAHGITRPTMRACICGLPV